MDRASPGARTEDFLHVKRHSNRYTMEPRPIFYFLNFYYAYFCLDLYYFFLSTQFGFCSFSSSFGAELVYLGFFLFLEAGLAGRDELLRCCVDIVCY